MDTVNISFVDWIPKALCDENVFHSCYDNEENDDLTENVAEGSDYMYLPLDNKITNDKLLKQNFVNKTKPTDDDKYLNYDNLTDSSVSIEDADRILIMGSNYDDSSTLQVALYNVDTCGLETHHEILLGSYPLTMQLVPRQNKGMLSCVGSYSPDITIWDIYDIDLLEPLSTLSLHEDKSINRGIISLDYSSPFLAAGSEDSSVYVWDLQRQELVNVFNNHNDKVQIVKWHNNDKNLLVSGAFDNKIRVTDIRTNNIAEEITVDCDVECALWYKDADSLLAGFEDGTIKHFDLRKIGKKPIWSIKNSKTPCTCLSLKSNILTASCLSGTARIYGLNDEQTCSKPEQVFKKKLDAGPIFTSSVSRDDEYLFAFGCKVLVIADLLTFEGLSEKLQTNHDDVDMM